MKKNELEALKLAAEKAQTDHAAASEAYEAAQKARSAAGFGINSPPSLARYAHDLAVLEADEAVYLSRFAARDAANAYDIGRGDADAIGADWRTTIDDLIAIAPKHAGIADVGIRAATISAEVNARVKLANESHARLVERRAAEGRPAPRGRFGPESSDVDSRIRELEAELARPVEFPRAHQLQSVRREKIAEEARLQRAWLEGEAAKERARLEAEQRRREDEARAERARQDAEAQRAAFQKAREEEEALAAAYRARVAGTSQPDAAA